MTTIITDQPLAEFLRKLQASDLILTEWESSFVASFLQCYRDWQFWTEPRRLAAQKMWMKYGADLNFPFPTDDVRRRKIPDANPAGCEYRVRLDGLQQPCNEPALFQNRAGFRYCRPHAELAVAETKKARGVLKLSAFAPTEVKS